MNSKSEGSPENEEKFPPDFELSPLSSFKISLLTGDGAPSEVQAFIISAAVAFNDLKDYYWLYQQLRNHEPPNRDQIEARRGQWNGMAIFSLRKVIATFHEFLELLQRSTELMNQKEMKKAFAVLDETTSSNWKDLVRFALSSEADLDEKEKNVVRLIMRVRHNVTSHYYGTKNFRSGLVAFEKEAPNSSHIYASFGKTMESTRFYFGDAAAQYFILEKMDELDVKLDEIVDYIRMMNNALRLVIEAYLKTASGNIPVNREILRKARRRR